MTRQKSQFDVPAACIQASDVSHRQLERVQHIGQVGLPGGAVIKAHQACGVASMSSFAGPQPHNRVKDALMTIVGVQDAVGGLLAQPRDVPIPHLGKTSRTRRN